MRNGIFRKNKEKRGNRPVASFLLAPRSGFEPLAFRLGGLTFPLQGVRPVHIIYILAVFRRRARSLAVDFVFFIVFMICQGTKAPNRVPKKVP